jgi:hypothetical protein
MAGWFILAYELQRRCYGFFTIYHDLITVMRESSYITRVEGTGIRSKL